MAEETDPSNPQENMDEPVSEEPIQPQPERPQTVIIQTPLDRPEMNFFVDSFMKKSGLTDRKQAAIMLTNMFYDMGLDPYADLKDLQKTMDEMNIIMKSMPDTPAAARVKDTLGAIYAAKAGDTMMKKMPILSSQGQDPMMDRMDKILEKYLPMVMGMKMVTQMMGGEMTPQQQQKQTAQVPDEVMKLITTIQAENRQILNSLEENKKSREQRLMKKDILSSINPQISALTQRLQDIAANISNIANQQASQPAAAQTPESIQTTEELRKLSSRIEEAVERIGSTAAAKGITLSDLDPVLEVLDKIDKRYGKKEPEGEFNWKSATISTVGEIAKEALETGKEIMAQRPPQPGPSQPAAQQPQQTNQATQMQQLIKRQVQNYILQEIGKGATQMNLQDAATTLGLSIEQVNWAYNVLVSEGFIKAPAGSSQPPAAQPQQPPRTQTPQQPQGGQPSGTTGTGPQPFFET